MKGHLLPTKPSAKGIIYTHTGLRGIAAITILLGHISNWHPQAMGLDSDFFLFFKTYGAAAVDFFFILSGFVLNWVYVKKGKPFIFSSYVRARVARLVPLYFLTLAILLPFPLYNVFRHGLTYMGKDFYLALISSIFMVSGILNGWHLSINHPSWSICVEFFCCLLLFPPLVRLNRVIEGKFCPTWIWNFSILVCTLGLAFCYRRHPISIGLEWWDCSWLASGAFGFSAGFFLCSLYRHTLTRRPFVPLINFFCLSALAIPFLSRLGYLPEYSILFTFPFLIYFTAFDLGVLASIMKIPCFQWLGEKSYSICLWNFSIIYLISITPIGKIHTFHDSHPLLAEVVYCLIIVTLVLVVSELSYRYFESPCREYIRNPRHLFPLFQKRTADPVLNSGTQIRLPRQ